MDKTKSKKLIAIILGITVFLALVSVGIAYYYYQIRDIAPNDSSAAEGCGCYYVKSSNSVKSCTDATPENAFAFKTGFKNDNGVCSVTCDERDAPDIRTEAGETPSILLCNVDTFPANPGCIDMAIKDEDGKRIAGEISPSESVQLEAVFKKPSTVTSDEEYFKDYSFIVNGEKIAIDKANVKETGTGVDSQYTITTQFSDYGEANKLTVQAFATTVTNLSTTSSACLRSINITKPKAASCTRLDVDVTADTKPTVNEVKIETGGISSVESLAVKFKMGTEEKIITTKDITDKYVDGTVILDKDFLYKTASFTTADSFSFFDSETNSIDLGSTVIINGNPIDSSACEVTESFTLNNPTDEDPDGNPDNNPDDDPNNNPDDNPDDEPSDTGETSNFAVAKSASKQCIERTGSNNTVVYTITVKNNDDAYEDIVSIKDKLPLGFTYVEGSSEINGVPTTDGMPEVTTTGSTQDLVWETAGGWSLRNGDTITITFMATATANALTGANLNEVIVTPVNTPVNSATLRAEASVSVQQSCTAPQTGLFDSTIAKVITGMVIVVLAAVFYNSQTSEKVSQSFLSSSIYDGVTSGFRLFGLKLTEPRKYFEEKSIHSIEKKRKRKTN